ncbi:hypothetical protein ACOSQ4_006871 [Xanthoceras sorbifolium]
MVGIDTMVKEVGESSGTAIIVGVKARGTRVVPEKSKNSKVVDKNNSVSGPAITGGVKGKGPMVTIGDGDASLVESLSVFRDISNMGPPPCKEVAGIKSGSLKSS